MRPERFELCSSDSAYPRHVLECDRAPECLYGIGDVSLLVEGIAIIGSRKATPYGLSAARMFAGYAASRGVPVISGAAMGCDQAAHWGALECGGPTVAVLGCGADVVYPSNARELLDRVGRDGLVISPFPWGMRPTRWSFLVRNQLIAQLCKVLLVVESRMPSGTFTTVSAAQDLGRDVYGVPGSIFAPECRGPNHLLAQGAGAIAEVSDLARVLDLGVADTPSGGDCSSDGAGRLLSALRTNPMSPDDAAYALGMDVVDVAVAMGELERSGHIVRFPGGRYGVVS